MKFLLKIFSVLFFGFLLIFLFSTFSKSKSLSHPTQQLTRPVVTVINPVRGPQLGLENVNLLQSLTYQWKLTKDAGVKATWLWQYSAMEDASLVDFAKNNMQKNCHAEFSSASFKNILNQVQDDRMCDQEFGLFLETDRNSSAKSGILYRGHGPWYFSDGLLLISYDKGEREKLIDAAFTKFKETFGYYPKTVGAWWVGADSLQYMKKNYHIVASLQVADQYDLDAYSVWGQPWSIPYIASQNNAAVPAHSFDPKTGIVIMQWAPRDPTYGYGNTSTVSTYSMQDYFLKKYDMSYIDYLLSVFFKGPGDQVVMGLESGLPPKSYDDDYKQKLVKIQELQRQQKIDILTAENFADAFLTRQQIFGTNAYFLSQGYQSQDQSFWYNSRIYRAGIEKRGKNVFLVDVRDYLNAGKEDFDLLPNSQGYLRVTVPAIIDSARNQQQKIILGETNTELRVQKDNEEIIITDGYKNFAILRQNEIVTAPKAFIFQEHKRPLNIFLLLFSVLFLYILILLMIQKEKKLIFINATVLFSCLFLARPFLIQGNFWDTYYLFDQKMLPLLLIFRYISIDLPIGMLIIFQIIPFVLLLTLHSLFVIKRKLLNLYIIGIFLFIVLYSHLPYALVTAFITKKKIAVIGTISIYLLLACITVGVVWYKKRKGIWTKTLGVLFAGFLVVSSTVLLSWQTYIITPFEMKSLQVINQMRKDVYFVMPKEMPMYRAVEPLLFENYKYVEGLTKTKWQPVVRPEGKYLALQELDTHIIFVPRYLGSDLYLEEIKKYKLNKIFDNAQIQIYSL